MDTSDKIRVVGGAIVWALVGIICFFWDINYTGDIGIQFLNWCLHIIYYASTIIGVGILGWWCLNDGADLLGDYLDKRKINGGG